MPWVKPVIWLVLGLLYAGLIALATSPYWLTAEDSLQVYTLGDEGWLVVHDQKRGVTCWEHNNQVSCLPDSFVLKD